MQVYLKAGFSRGRNLSFRIFSKVYAHFVSKKKTPVIINNFNRLECLKKQISWFEKAGFKHIYIIDNLSTYPPLLAFYLNTKHIVFRLDKNVGHTALWDTHIFLLFKNQYYIYTDPDVIPTQNCPSNFVEYFKALLDKYLDKGKVGMALKINDLPDYYLLKNEVISLEKHYWNVELETNVYDALVDTTLALYRPNSKGDAGLLPALRVGGAYEARHLPWYKNTFRNNEEDSYYLQSATSAASWNEKLKEKKAQ
jgi:hypothetical protein